MSDVLEITGGVPLKGEVTVSGAKNAATKLLIASLLSDKKSVFSNVPNVTEITATVDLCREIGSIVEWDKEAKTIEIITPHIRTSFVPQRFSGANRIPILLLGPLLGRTREKITLPVVGGCRLGKRPVDFHIEGVKALGASVVYDEEREVYIAHNPKQLVGTIIELPYPSVGATENLIMAAVKAKGRTIIKNAASEPEIFDLILFLQKMGVQIFMDVSRTIHIFETHTFEEVQHTIISDRNQAASLAVAALATAGDVMIRGSYQRDLVTFLNVLRQMNAKFSVYDDGIRFFHTHPPRGNVHIETAGHPGFMTDWQQPFVVLLTQATGFSVVHETVYENRLGYIQTLKEMGAHIETFSQCLGNKSCRFNGRNHMHSAVIHGPTPLTRSTIAIPDLRGGFAYVMAALVAEGTSLISNLNYLDRGYENLETILANLGASITRKSPLPV